MIAPFGKNIKLYIEGSSHSPEMSLRLTGIPAGVEIDMGELMSFLKRRSPSGAWDTPRREEDVPIFRSGIKNGKTTGGEICAAAVNRNVSPSDYSLFARLPRPSHADYPALIKYGNGSCIEGGGIFSGRMTLLTCIAGFIAREYLKSFGVSLFAHIYSIGEIKDIPLQPTAPEALPYAHSELAFYDAVAGENARELLSRVREGKNSVGGVIECAVIGLPVGLGEHIYESVESCLCQAVFGVPGVKGIEFGAGFASAEMYGSEFNDSYYFDGNKVKTRSNNSGGILGGMTNGMPVIFRVALKPTPSIGLEQDTVDLLGMENARLTINGRHDACIVPRAVPVIEAAAALAFADLISESSEGEVSLESLRGEIDSLDTELVRLLNSRTELSKKIAAQKAKNGMPVFDALREKQLLERLSGLASEDNEELIKNAYALILANSKRVQEKSKKG